MFNTIILLKGSALLTKKEYEKFSKGDTIWGDGSNPDEINRWNISDNETAKEELKKYSCSYNKGTESYSIEEYALEYCECDEDGEFIQGSDYDLAEKR